jgi:hypothetical protein
MDSPFNVARRKLSIQRAVIVFVGNQSRVAATFAVSGRSWSEGIEAADVRK